MEARKYFGQHRLSVIVGMVMVAALVIGLAIFIPLQLRSGSPTTKPTSTATPEQGIVWGPRACPAGTGDPARWDTIIGTKGSDSKVEKVICANILGNTSVQALVTVRHDDANSTLDAYVFTRITSAKPVQLFKMQSLLKGDAKISSYNTVMTAEVDQNSSANAGKTRSQWTQDLFREFKWNATKETLVQVAFPGIFPDLTRWQAEADQYKAMIQPDTWQLDAMKTAEHFVAQYMPTAPTNPPAQLQLVSGGGAHDLTARVNVAFPNGTNLGPITKLTLQRLEGNAGGVWEVTAVLADWMYISSPQSGPATHISNPVTVTGYGSQFESQVGTIYILDHLYTPIGQAYAMGSAGFGNGSFTVQVPYTSSYQGGAQEGIVELAHSGGASFDSGLVFLKVLVNP